jgi:hypothetical protein
VKTVFVLGAGASQTIGMPTGKELKESISNLLTVDNWHTGSKIIDDAIHYLSYKDKAEEGKCREKEGHYITSANTISTGLPREISIDNF